MSCDGVKECRSNSVSLDVYTSRFRNCSVVYPHRIVRPLAKYKGIDNQKQLKLFIKNILENGLDIDEFLGDNPKRAHARNCLCHSSKFPCEYCVAKGVLITMCDEVHNEMKKDIDIQLSLINDKLQNMENNNNEEKTRLLNVKKSLEKKKNILNSKKQLVWPASTANAEPRTREQYNEILSDIDNLRPDDKKGVVGKSVFFDIPNFNFIRGFPTEYLHSVCLGNGKRLCELTFCVGEIRPRKTTRKLSKPNNFNRLMSLIKTPREFPRRARNLDFSVYKGAEFRNLVIFYFPLVIECIEEGHGERKLWLYLGYMIRACILPSNEYEAVNTDDITDCSNKYYHLYEKLMGPSNCTYNTHIVLSHLLEMRANGPLPSTSAFGFESFYGEMRHAFVPETVSPLKQIMKTIFLKRNLSNHCCELPIYYANYDTCLENNTLIYCWNNNEHDIYVIQDIIDEDNFSCKKMGKYTHEFPETPRLNWSRVGLYKKGGMGPDIYNVKKNEIDGKVLEVNNLLITCPNIILREK